MGINTYSKNIPELMKFMEWYFQPEQQKRYAAVCQTGLKSVLDSPEWQGLNRYNKQFCARSRLYQRLLASARVQRPAR